MPHFYTNIHNGHGYQRDEEGRNFRDLKAARQHAIEAGADIIADELKRGCDTVHVSLEIEDSARVHVASVPMTGMIET